jgi:hypothetical protein
MPSKNKNNTLLTAGENIGRSMLAILTQACARDQLEGKIWNRPLTY